MPTKYVMATAADGRSEIITSKPVATEGAIDLWINFETPADLSSAADPTEGRTLMHEPPRGGSIFRIVSPLSVMTR